MKIRQKLLLTFIGLSLLVGIVGYVYIKSLKDISTDIHQIRESSILELESSTEMAFEFIAIKGLLKEYIQKTKEPQVDEAALAKQKLEECFSYFEKALAMRRKATESGVKLYAKEGQEKEKDELVKLKYLEDKYMLYKKDILACIMAYEAKADKSVYKFHENEINKDDSVLVEELKFFKQEAQDEIAFETMEAESSANHSTNSMLVVVVLSLVLAVIAGVYISRSIVSPILKLKNAVQNITLGKMAFIKELRTKDEIADLTISFNRMTADLKESRSLIEEHNRKLEQKVVERTKELEENIEVLKQTEQKLKYYTTQLKTSNLELEQFAYVASHDLQEPLRTTSNFAELLQKRYKGKLDAKADDYFNYILQSAERMRVLIKDLLDYSRIGREKQREPVDCNLILKELLTDLSVAIQETNAEIKLDDLPVIDGHPTEIKQLFQNLVMNAIKFSRKNVPPRIDILAQKNSGYWLFSIKDNGIGIDSKYKDKIFIIFQRLNNRKEYEGSGIGLAHCKKIVEMHGGKIWTEPTPGHGTTFYFTISSNSDSKMDQ